MKVQTHLTRSPLLKIPLSDLLYRLAAEWTIDKIVLVAAEVINERELV